MRSLAIVKLKLLLAHVTLFINQCARPVFLYFVDVQFILNSVITISAMLYSIRMRVKMCYGVCVSCTLLWYRFLQLFPTSKIPVRWPGQCYDFTLSLIFKYCGGI